MSPGSQSEDPHLAWLCPWTCFLTPEMKSGAARRDDLWAAGQALRARLCESDYKSPP